MSSIGISDSSGGPFLLGILERLPASPQPAGAAGNAGSAGTSTRRQLAEALFALGRVDEAERINGEPLKAVKAARLVAPVSASGDRRATFAPPHEVYSRSVGTAVEQGYLPFDARAVVSWEGKEVGYASFKERMERQRSTDPDGWTSFMREHGLVRTDDGEYCVDRALATGFSARKAPGGAGGTAAMASLLASGLGLAPMLGMSPATYDSFASVAALPRRESAGKGAAVGAATGALGGALGGGILGGPPGALVGATMGGVAGGLAGGLAGAGRPSPMGSFWSVAGPFLSSGKIPTDGLQFQARRALGALAADVRDESMISMIENRGIPIENLVFALMAYMAQKYEDKLREKGEELVFAEKMQRRQERRSEDARNEAARVQALSSMGGSIAGGLASMIPVVGPIVGGVVQGGANLAGMQAAQQITTHADRVNELDAAVNGNAKSVTMVNNELQILMSQWKNLNDALGNIIKTLSDMAQNSIRNMKA